MDYHSMSIADLKKAAKDHRPRIKHYYIKTRLELIQLLSMKELPQSYVVEKMKISELRQQAKEKGFIGIWRLRKRELIDLLYPSAEKNDKNDDRGDKHHAPKEGEGKKIGV